MYALLSYANTYWRQECLHAYRCAALWLYIICAFWDALCVIRNPKRSHSREKSVLHVEENSKIRDTCSNWFYNKVQQSRCSHCTSTPRRVIYWKIIVSVGGARAALVRSPDDVLWHSVNQFSHMIDQKLRWCTKGMMIIICSKWRTRIYCIIIF